MSIFLVVLVLLANFVTNVSAFGAGDIPEFAYLNDRAFRHGDIENALLNLAKVAGHAEGHASMILHALGSSSGINFNKGDIKKVYFGNWLRDYSQAMDIAGLRKLTADTIVLLIAVLGFMTFGFATEEFQITAERLGVYLPTEHIDNPKGYAEREGDARRFHPKLRPPVNPQELEIDSKNGMKKYMATEGHSWDTSTALVRRTFHQCIEHGRKAKGHKGPELWEAYRLLGTGLHTMEDLLAHSNWCELALRKAGHKEVFCHVGEKVSVHTPNGLAPPLVTGTFGSADFLHSLMGEATDHLSQSSVADLTDKINEANKHPNENIANLRSLLSKISFGGGSEKMKQGEEICTQSQSYDFNPDNIAHREVQHQLFALLTWRDNLYREIISKIEMVPGMNDLLDNLNDALNKFVYTVIAPWLSPILAEATSVLEEESKAIINSDDQYEVFDNPHASDPSHSFLSKDHFGLILNEPAGLVAKIVVENTVKHIVQAWFNDDLNSDGVIDEILEAFHHPYFATGQSQVQNAMYLGMEVWLTGLGPERARKTIEALTKESVRAGTNKRLGVGSEEQMDANVAPGGQGKKRSQGVGTKGTKRKAGPKKEEKRGLKAASKKTRRKVEEEEEEEEAELEEDDVGKDDEAEWQEDEEEAQSKRSAKKQTPKRKGVKTETSKKRKPVTTKAASKRRRTKDEDEEDELDDDILDDEEFGGTNEKEIEEEEEEGVAHKYSLRKSARKGKRN